MRGFPTHAVRYCLKEANLTLSDVDYLVFYDKPFVKFERILETYLNYAPSGLRSFVSAMPIWLKEKLYLKWTLRQELAEIGGSEAGKSISLLFAEHHQSHAASAFFLSPSKMRLYFVSMVLGNGRRRAPGMGVATSFIALGD